MPPERSRDGVRYALALGASVFVLAVGGLFAFGGRGLAGAVTFTSTARRTIRIVVGVAGTRAAAVRRRSRGRPQPATTGRAAAVLGTHRQALVWLRPSARRCLVRRTRRLRAHLRASLRRVDRAAMFRLRDRRRRGARREPAGPPATLTRRRPREGPPTAAPTCAGASAAVADRGHSQRRCVAQQPRRGAAIRTSRTCPLDEHR